MKPVLIVIATNKLVMAAFYSSVALAYLTKRARRLIISCNMILVTATPKETPMLSATE